MAKRKKMDNNRPPDLKIALICGCSHDPYCDNKFWLATCDFAKRLKPDVFHRNGDMFDFYQISRFDKDPERADTMAQDREVFWEHEDQMEKSLPKDCVKVASRGNHEDRVYDYLLHNPDIRLFMKNFGMTMPTWDSFLGLDKRGYIVHDTESDRCPQVMYGNLMVWHGAKFNKFAVAHNVMSMGNNACNHTHRCREWASIVGGKVMYGYEMGHMADKKLATDYIKDIEDWCQGFGLVYFDDTTGYFDVDVVMVHEIRDGRQKRFNYKSDYWEWDV